MFRYLPIKESYYSDELGNYISFGIVVLNVSGSIITTVPDVSLDEKFVAELCCECTVNQLDPIHLLDVIEDRL